MVLNYGIVVDNVWLNDVPADTDLAAMVGRIYQALKLGGVVVVTVPFGLSPGRPPTRALYLGSVRRLLEPLFEVTTRQLLEGHIAVVARRRDRPAGEPVFEFDEGELAFREHDHRLHELLDQTSGHVRDAGAKYRDARRTIQELRTDLDRMRGELAGLRRKLRRITLVLAGPRAVLRTIRRLRRAAVRRGKRNVTAPWSRECRRKECRRLAALGHGGAGPGGNARATSPVASRPASSGQRTAGQRHAPGPGREALKARFEAWLHAARQAEGGEVVVMFSGTTFVQEHRGNRPIRLTNAYLDQRCPVFFNYYRWNDKDPLPDHHNSLLFQSPIDATPEFLDALLTADFGGKSKIFFASFPHLQMVRHLTVAAQHGWVTVYDARDDWEEFAKVGMAKWYHPGYERYVATHADVATAVSRPLARKIAALAEDRVVHVVPNALDTRFPRPERHRAPAQPPVIGYFGHLTDKWFDWPLVIAAAERYPDYTFELAGHQQPQLALPGNVRLLGLLGHRELAERSGRWSVALIPFKNGPLADAVDPIKIYEYLHLRLPVLATYFPQCRDYPGTTITESRDEFLERLPELVGTELPEPDLDKWLEVNTWQCRVDTYSRLADEVRHTGRGGVAALLGGEW